MNHMYFNVPNNPHDILTEPLKWADFVYQAGAGSRQQIYAFAKRWILMTNVNRAVNVDPAVKAAIQFLMEVDGAK
jgi:hypothetical protein